MPDGEFKSDKPNVKELIKIFNELITDKEMSGKILINVKTKHTAYAYLSVRTNNDDNIK